MENKYKTNIPMIEKFYGEILKHIRIYDPLIRLSEKPMMAVKHGEKDSPNIYSRRDHEEEMAEIAGNIAEGIGANPSLAKMIALLHDIGQGDGAHQGEHTLQEKGELDNIAIYKHAAVGARILLEENFIQDVIDNLLEKGKITELEGKQLKKEFFFVIDGVISHDGESSKEIISLAKTDKGEYIKDLPLDDVEKYVRNKLSNIFTGDKSIPILPITIEGAIVRTSDVISYTRSDRRDGSRLSGIENSEADLEIIANAYIYLKRKGNPEFAKIVEEEERYYELLDNIQDINKEHITEDQYEMIKNIEQASIKHEKLHAKKIEIAKKWIQQQIDKKGDKKALEFIDNFKQDAIIESTIEYSKDKDFARPSPFMRYTQFRLRAENLKIVKFTRTESEKKAIPEAKCKLVDELAETLLKTGTVWEKLPDELKKGLTPKYSEDKFEKNREKLLANIEKKETIKNPKIKKGLRFVFYGILKNTPSRCKKMCDQKLYKRFNRLYKENKEEIINQMYTISKGTRVTANNLMQIAKEEIAFQQEKAKRDKPEENKNIEKRTIKGKILENEYSKKIDKIKFVILSLCPNGITEEVEEQLKQYFIKQGNQNIEERIAKDVAIMYVFGMTDKSIKRFLKDKGLITDREIYAGDFRSKIWDNKVANYDWVDKKEVKKEQLIQVLEEYEKDENTK